MTSEKLRKIAKKLRDHSETIQKEKTIKCAKYIIGRTALKLLEEKLK